MPRGECEAVLGIISILPEKPVHVGIRIITFAEKSKATRNIHPRIMGSRSSLVKLHREYGRGVIIGRCV
jgi:hypothetical protein